MATAFLTLTNGLQMGPPAWLPSWATKAAFQLLSALRSGKEISALLRTLPADVALVNAVDFSPAALGTIRCPTLLLWGTQSPRYLKRGAEELEHLVPGARREAIGGAGHNAPDMEAPLAVAEALGRFFGARA
jgi:pimeloyl-ACP methyl ester carboxylesterase